MMRWLLALIRRPKLAKLRATYHAAAAESADRRAHHERSAEREKVWAKARILAAEIGHPLAQGRGR